MSTNESNYGFTETAEDMHAMGDLDIQEFFGPEGGYRPRMFQMLEESEVRETPPGWDSVTA